LENTKAKNKKKLSPEKGSMSSLFSTQEEMTASRGFSDLRVQYKEKNITLGARHCSS